MQNLNLRGRILWKTKEASHKPIASRIRKGRFLRNDPVWFDNKGDLSVASSFPFIEWKLQRARIYGQKR